MINNEITTLLQNTLTTTDLAVNLSYLESLQAEAFKTPSDRSTSEMSSDEIAKAISELKARPVITLEIARPLPHPGLQKIVAWCHQNLAKPVILGLKIDHSLIGGAKISFQGRYLDKSLALALTQI